MAKFADKAGREWDVSLDLGIVTAIRKACGIDLGAILGDQKRLVHLFYEDLNSLGVVLFTLVESQAEERKIDGDGFARALDGPSLNRAREALAEAIANFSQPPKTADAMTDGIKKLLTAVDERAAAMTTAAITDALTSNGSGTNSAASAA